MRDKETQDLVDKFTQRYGKNIHNWHWNYIGQVEKLTENFIREFKDRVIWSSWSSHNTYWSNISAYQKLSEDFIKEFKEDVNWSHISAYQKLSEDFIKEFKEDVHWGNISAYQKLSEDFIKEFQDYIVWSTFVKFNPSCPPDVRIKWMKEHNLIKKQDPNTHEIEYHEEVEKSKNNSLEELKQLISINIDEKIIIAQSRDKETQALIDKFTSRGYGKNLNDWNWTDISYRESLSEDFIREFQDKVSWHDISAHQKLSENFIREFKDKVIWFRISVYQRLSEDFIREFQDYVDWDFISINQKLSEDFIRKFKDKINKEFLVKFNPDCPTGIKIEYMKEHNIIKKQDPETHEIEYHEESEKPKNNSLEELKQLISINLDEKIRIEGIEGVEGQNEQNKEDIYMPKITKIAQHIHKNDYPSIEDVASYTEAIKLFKQRGKISDPELEILIDNLPSPQNIKKSLSNSEIKIIFRTIWYLWHKITGINLIEDTKVEQKKEVLEGNYWMIHKGVLMSGPNHYTIIKNNLNLFRSLLGIHAFALHEKMGSPPNELIKLVLDNGGIRIFVNQDRVAYFQLSAETYAKWGKQKIMKYEFHKKIVMVIDVDAPYKGWRSGVRVSLK